MTTIGKIMGGGAPIAAFGGREDIMSVLAPDGSTLPAYQIPLGGIQLRVIESTTEQIQTTARLITAKRTHITASTTNPPVDINIWGDETGRLQRVRRKRHRLAIDAHHRGQKLVGVDQVFGIGPIMHHEEPAGHPLLR